MIAHVDSQLPLEACGLLAGKGSSVEKVLLDEPETPLSPQRQLAFLALLKEMVGEGAQFLIATHSPILMAYPGASLLVFEEGTVESRAYDEVEHVRLTRDFLSCPERYLRYL